MIKFRFLALLFLIIPFGIKSQDLQIIQNQEVSSILKTLSSDEMEGRGTFTAGIEKAADFIASEFEKTGLQKWDDLPGYRQSFSLAKKVESSVRATINEEPIAFEKIIAITTEEHLSVTESDDYQQVELKEGDNFFRTIMNVLSSHQPSIVWIPEGQEENFNRLSRLGNRPIMKGSASVLFVLHSKAEKFKFVVDSKFEYQPLFNVIGVLPGKSLKDEFVVFSAHYDHLGIGKSDERGDSIYNGANDDASGTTAVVMLAKYFKALNNNERTLIFVTFTAEEIGGFGSQYFSGHIDPDKVVAMFNIEMIGTDSMWGKNSGYITGFEKSDFGKILQKNLEGSQFRFEPDPYPQENLFYRSDNATLARLGVPAHTLSTSQMDNEPHYHKQSDEFETLDMNNMTEFIRAIALSSKTIVSGEDTPSRVKAESLQ